MLENVGVGVEVCEGELIGVAVGVVVGVCEGVGEQRAIVELKKNIMLLLQM